MGRPRRAVLAAIPLALLLAGCGGGGSASQGSVRDQAREGLAESERYADLTDAQVSEAADCISRGLFEGGFEKEERDDVTQALDGDEPSEALTGRVVELVDGCTADAQAGGSDEGDEETTTTGEG